MSSRRLPPECPPLRFYGLRSRHRTQAALVGEFPAYGSHALSLACRGWKFRPYPRKRKDYRPLLDHPQVAERARSCTADIVSGIGAPEAWDIRPFDQARTIFSLFFLPESDFHDKIRHDPRRTNDNS